MHTIKIIRSDWARGQQNGSKLIDKDNKKCCLGFVGEQCGMPYWSLNGESTPEDVNVYLLRGVFRNLLFREQNTGVTYALMMVNDAVLGVPRYTSDHVNKIFERAGIYQSPLVIISEQQREEYLNKICDAYPDLGFRFEFVGD